MKKSADSSLENTSSFDRILSKKHATPEKPDKYPDYLLKYRRQILVILGVEVFCTRLLIGLSNMES